MRIPREISGEELISMKESTTLPSLAIKPFVLGLSTIYWQT